MLSKSLHLIAVAVLACAFSACQMHLKSMQSDAEKRGFISDGIEDNSDLLPFDLVHLSPDYAAKREQYRKVYVAPLDVSALMDIKKLKGKELEEARKGVASYQDRLVKEIQKKSKGRMQVVKTPSKDALTLEMHVLALSRNNVVLNVAAFLVPVPCSSQLAHTAFQGRVEMAARVLDPATGKPIAEVLDRDAGAYAAYSVKDYKRYGHTKEAFDHWVEIFGDMFAAPKAEKVKAPAPVTLKPV